MNQITILSTLAVVLTTFTIKENYKNLFYILSIMYNGFNYKLIIHNCINEIIKCTIINNFIKTNKGA